MSYKCARPIRIKKAICGARIEKLFSIPDVVTTPDKRDDSYKDFNRNHTIHSKEKGRELGGIYCPSLQYFLDHLKYRRG
jgi:hypothetical protein